MSVSMRILGWKASGLRCPDHEVSFRTGTKNNVYPISLMQMPNGTGKTTTLALIRAALSGSAENWSKEVVATFQKRDSDKDKGKFRLDLYVGDRLLTLELNFDFLKQEVKYKTTNPDTGGNKDGFRPPTKAQSFF